MPQQQSKKGFDMTRFDRSLRHRALTVIICGLADAIMVHVLPVNELKDKADTAQTR